MSELSEQLRVLVYSEKILPCRLQTIRMGRRWSEVVGAVSFAESISQSQTTLKKVPCSSASDKLSGIRLFKVIGYGVRNHPTHLANDMEMEFESYRHLVGEAFLIRSVGSRHYDCNVPRGTRGLIACSPQSNDNRPIDRRAASTRSLTDGLACSKYLYHDFPFHPDRGLAHQIPIHQHHCTYQTEHTTP